jgi:hypothetical protein
MNRGNDARLAVEASPVPYFGKGDAWTVATDLSGRLAYRSIGQFTPQITHRASIRRNIDGGG